jgi:hypothetical protein
MLGTALGKPLGPALGIIEGCMVGDPLDVIVGGETGFIVGILLDEMDGILVNIGSIVKFGVGRRLGRFPTGDSVFSLGVSVDAGSLCELGGFVATGVGSGIFVWSFVSKFGWLVATSLLLGCAVGCCSDVGISLNTDGIGVLGIPFSCKGRGATVSSGLVVDGKIDFFMCGFREFMKFGCWVAGALELDGSMKGAMVFSADLESVSIGTGEPIVGCTASSDDCSA